MDKNKSPSGQDTIWTYQSYESLPSDGKVYQIIGGSLHMTPSPGFDHQDISFNLGLLLGNFVKKGKLGKVVAAPMDVILSETDVVQPDILYISSGRMGIVGKRGVEGAPDLVVEVISPSTRMIDEEVKKGLYERHGVREYLLVYPEEKKVVQYALRGGSFGERKVFVIDDVVPLVALELELVVSEIFGL